MDPSAKMPELPVHNGKENTIATPVSSTKQLATSAFAGQIHTCNICMLSEDIFNTQCLRTVLATIEHDIFYVQQPIQESRQGM